jgi:hypothetical protein
MRRVTAALLMLFAVLIAAAPATSHAAPMAPVSAQGEDDSAKAQGDRCVVRAEALEPDGSQLVTNTHDGVLLSWQCEALAAAQAVEGFRLVTESGRVYFYPPHRILRLEILPVR